MSLHHCTEAECPYLGQPTTTSCGCHKTDEQVLKERVSVLTVALTNVIVAIDDLIANSSGVAGLHLNGDLAPWDELVIGGRYGEWLLAIESGRAVLDESKVL